MQLRYMNTLADGQDIQVPAIQVEPMKHGATYEVENKLGLALMESNPAHWKEVLPKEDKPKPATRQERATVIKEGK